MLYKRLKNFLLQMQELHTKTLICGQQNFRTTPKLAEFNQAYRKLSWFLSTIYILLNKEISTLRKDAIFFWIRLRRNVLSSSVDLFVYKYNIRKASPTKYQKTSTRMPATRHFGLVFCGCSVSWSKSALGTKITTKLGFSSFFYRTLRLFDCVFFDTRCINGNTKCTR